MSLDSANFSHDDSGARPGVGAFPHTRWSLVSRIRGGGEGEDRALDQICRAYWEPLYAFARRQGLAVEDAQDATQGFFAHLIGNQTLHAADENRGKLRTFLLASFTNFLSDERDKRDAWRRGGRTETISFDAIAAEERYQLEPAQASTAEILYHRRWALTLLSGALADLEKERRNGGRDKEMEILRGFLDASESASGLSYEEAAAKLGWTVNATRVAVHRLRLRYRQILQDQVAATLGDEDPAAVREELLALLAALS
ncbi:MAG: hypothetical protein MUF13_09605 [Akkermansiaceae bacterium]|nr:hypothetical protein [Akkermansiaceae bacterium]